MSQTIMAQEAAQSPAVIRSQLSQNQQLCADLAEQIRQFDPALVYMIGRGSSDHAGVFGKYLIEVELGLPVCAAAPSVATLFGQTLKLDRALVICISQSGRSPDILAQVEKAQHSGALVLALVNDQTSPLATMADCVLPLHAGEEKAVAATKSYLATLSALLQLVAHWKQDSALLDALLQLPDALQAAIEQPVQLTTEFVSPLTHCVVLGRSFGYAIGREIALKIKEVCGIHAESFSSAEFLHGPVTLVASRLSVVNIELNDASAASHKTQIDDVVSRGAPMITLSQAQSGLHPRLAPLAVLQRFYLDIEKIAREMGKNPDTPVGLNKVTKTL